MTRLILTTILLNIPTATLTLYVGLGIQNRFISFRKLFLFGLLSGVLVTFYRYLPIPFGLHIPLYSLTLIIILHYLSNNTWSMSIFCGMAAHLISAIGEVLIVAPVLLVKGISLRTAIESPRSIIIAGWLGNIILIVIACIMFIQNRSKNVGK